MIRFNLALTEEAVSLLAENRADFRSAERGSGDSSVGRIRVKGSLGPHDPAQTRLEAMYLRYVSIVEAYVDSLSGHLFRQKVAGHEPTLRLLVADAELRASNTWNERKSAFSRYHSFSIETFGRWSEFDAAIDVRNSIAHGLGSLTRRQRDQKTRAKIRSIGAILIDDHVVLSVAVLDQCYSICRELILYVDSQVESA
ncbi:hypothetical protein [Lentzea aerocolonigenes]|uniref:hypothetical protein n=1 Tax=Lentzea aerocolonigenes TaxID=68170 RepID=UPI0012E11A69|nr:hypothetical protein [Lentzea aerocolonigenes]